MDYGYRNAGIVDKTLVNMTNTEVVEGLLRWMLLYITLKMIKNMK